MIRSFRGPCQNSIRDPPGIDVIHQHLLKIELIMQKICIVGNKQLPLNSEDYGSSIDTMDMVVRISKMDHIRTTHSQFLGKIGQRVDWLILEPNDIWEATPEKNLDLAHMADLVFIRNEWYDRRKEKLIHIHGFEEERLVRIPPSLIEDKNNWTTAGLAVFLMHTIFPHTQIHLYCLDFFNRESFLRNIPWHSSSPETCYMRNLFLTKQLIPMSNC